MRRYLSWLLLTAGIAALSFHLGVVWQGGQTALPGGGASEAGRRGPLPQAAPPRSAIPQPVSPPATTAPPQPAGQVGEVQAFFSRDDDPRGVILSCLAGTRYSALVAAYYLTDASLAEALVAAQGRGVQVRVYLDRSQASTGTSQARALVAAGVPVRISSNSAIMHNKFAVLDEGLVLTGSFNWTRAASEENDENLVVIRDRTVAARYRERFAELWEQWDPGRTTSLGSPLPPRR